MSALAMFKLPYADSYTITEQSSGQPEELHDLRLLDGKSGFVVAPFRITDSEPLLLLPLRKPTPNRLAETADLRVRFARKPPSESRSVGGFFF